MSQSAIDALADEGVKPVAVAFVYGEGIHLLPTGGHLVNSADVQIPVKSKGKGTWNGRCAHNEYMGALITSVRERRTLGNAEAMLLVGYDKSESFALYPIGNKGVSTYYHIYFFCRIVAYESTQDLRLFAGLHGSAEQSRAIAELFHHGLRISEMLTGKYFRRCHQHTAVTVLCRKIHCRLRAHGLSASHVADHDAVHGRHGAVFSEIAADSVYNALLRPRKLKGLAGKKPLGIKIGKTYSSVPRAASRAYGNRKKPEEHLVEHEAPCGTAKSVLVLWTVDVIYCVSKGAKLPSFSYLRRQRIRKGRQKGVYGCMHRFFKSFAGKSLRHSVHGYEIGRRHLSSERLVRGT